MKKLRDILMGIAALATLQAGCGDDDSFARPPGAAGSAIEDHVSELSGVGDDTDRGGRPFIGRRGRELRMRGGPFRVVGASNYYLMYKSQPMVDDVLNTAAASGFNAMRVWASLDIGNQDGSNSVDGVDGRKEGVYFHYWDGSAPAFNDGADGLARLDYVVYKAGLAKIRLIFPFVNNWNAFGGMDQYVRWRGGQAHDDFYTDPTIRTWYKDWISHLLNRVNIYTGIAYKDDATIMTWELANEPRCKSAGAYPQFTTCNTQTLIDWADDVSRFIKSIDRRHLVAVGDEGFFCTPGATDWTENCGEGVDTLALADLPKIDVMSYHLYPDGWGKDAAWGTDWIQRHIQEGRRIHERALLGEFGLLDKATRNPVYREWTDTVLRNNGAGAMYWMLADKQDNGSYYPDYDGFTVYCPSPVCSTFSHFADMLLGRRPFTFPPVADHDSAVTELNMAVTLRATANDIAYGRGVPLAAESVDLDPATAGQQTEYATAAGNFALQPGGDVLFTPALDFSGNAVASYVVADATGRVSNPADLTIKVKPDPNAAMKLYSFETGIEGWAAASWQTTAGPVAQSSDFASDGTHSLKVDQTNAAAGDGWFGLTVAPTPLNLTPKTHLKFEIQTTGAGTSANAALQLTDRSIWCQGPWGYINAATTATVDIDLLALDCGITDVTNVRAAWVWFGAGGVFYLDNVRAE